MGKLSRNSLLILGLSVSLGIFADFLFNGIVIRYFLNTVPGAAWIVIYGPVYLTLAATLSTAIHRSKAFSSLTTLSAVCFLVGTALGHVIFVGYHSSRTYEMILVPESSITLFRSNDWPQILFVDSEKVHQELPKYSANEKIPVTVSVTSDYGCIRSAVVNTVAHVDVKNDSQSTWTWRMDVHASTREIDGPGLEDHILPWCRHLSGLKAMEDGPTGTRPWDLILEKIDH